MILWTHRRKCHDLWASKQTISGNSAAIQIRAIERNNASDPRSPTKPSKMSHYFSIHLFKKNPLKKNVLLKPKVEFFFQFMGVWDKIVQILSTVFFSRARENSTSIICSSSWAIEWGELGGRHATRLIPQSPRPSLPPRLHLQCFVNAESPVFTLESHSLLLLLVC